MCRSDINITIAALFAHFFIMLFPTITIPAKISATDKPISRPDTNSCTSDPVTVPDMALQAMPRTIRMIPYNIHYIL